MNCGMRTPHYVHTMATTHHGQSLVTSKIPDQSYLIGQPPVMGVPPKVNNPGRPLTKLSQIHMKAFFVPVTIFKSQLLFR
jgi:hypothetical protein